MEDKKREIGNILGWDYARFGITPYDDVPESVREGYESGKRQFPNPRRNKSDEPYIKKWLQLRRYALKRNKLVDDGIDANYIKTIHFPKCPVTLVDLTQSQGKGSDWSVDRLNNNGAYAPGNLAVMSTQANRAKGDKNFDDVYALATGGNNEERIGSLTRREWLRMACIMYGPCFVEIRNPVHLPLATFLPKKIAMPAWLSFQLFLLHMLQPHDQSTNLLIALKELLGDAVLERQLYLVLKRLAVRLNMCDFTFDAFVDDELQDGIYALANGLSVEQYQVLDNMVQTTIGAKSLTDFMVDSWSLDTKGLIASSRPPNKYTGM